MIKLKNSYEIARIRDASEILVETLKELIKITAPGQTTKELEKTAKNILEKRGAKPSFLNYMGFPSALCTSINQEVIHGIPNNRKLKEGDIISIDLGVELSGYFSDCTVTLPIGKVSEEARRLLKVTEECLYRGISVAYLGNRIHDISRAIYQHAKKHGYGIVRQFCGHGVGFSQHEDPQIPNYIGSGPNPRIKKGMVLAIEPMINLGTDDVKILDDGWTVETSDGKLSAHFEHTIAIFEDYTEILTKFDSMESIFTGCEKNENKASVKK
ncbi:MAG: type I methionyl aminopeptidase [Spirochaetes bacterium]|nr:MAG: type I methionyl aminopeptidase [Spirochaetota bacterium]